MKEQTLVNNCHVLFLTQINIAPDNVVMLDEGRSFNPQISLPWFSNVSNRAGLLVHDASKFAPVFGCNCVKAARTVESPCL